MFVDDNEGRRRIFFVVILTWKSRTAVPILARAVPSFWILKVWLGIVWHGRATFGTSRAKPPDVWLQNFHLFSNRSRTITCKIT